jgi:hypothetical protein
MRHRIVAIAAGAALSVGGLAAAPVVAEASPAPAHVTHHQDGTPAKRGLRCVAAGVRTLAELGILDDAARRQVDYSQFADPQNGPIFTTLPPGSYLSLGAVIKLHLTNPELFAWCR